MDGQIADLERKYCEGKDGVALTGATEISGYASLFGVPDGGGDVVMPGAYAACLAALGRAGRRVRMLWQHEAREPVGVWDEMREDARGLWVKGRVLPDVTRGREALALIRAGAIEGLSIGYRTVRAEPRPGGGRRLYEIELWEVSLVTFPMLAEARIAAKAGEAVPLAGLAEVFRAAGDEVAGRRVAPAHCEQR